MHSTTYTKASKTAAESVVDMEEDIWYIVASNLTDLQILPLRQVSKEWRRIWSTRDIWFDKLTTLVLQYPAMGQLEQGARR